MNIKLEIEGKKYEIAITYDGDDAHGLPNLVYEVFGFNPDSSSVLLMDSADDCFGNYSDAASDALFHLIDQYVQAEDTDE